MPAAWNQYGLRVPAFVISPFAKRNYVSHVVHDHTSVLRFIETKFNLGALTRRDANADNLLDCLDFRGRPRSSSRRRSPRRACPATGSTCQPNTPPPPDRAAANPVQMMTMTTPAGATRTADDLSCIADAPLTDSQDERLKALAHLRRDGLIPV